MKEKKLCDICGSKMTEEKKHLAFQLSGETYHGDALMYHCELCGYEKLGTCSVKFWENDEPVESGAADTDTEDKKETKMLSKVNGKAVISDDWLDCMIESKPWFRWFYTRLVSKKHQEKRYLEQHAPTYKAILNNVLYDTEASRMYLMSEQDFGNEMCRRYYYMTESRKFFRVTVKYGSANEISTMEIKDVKKILAHKPDIYKEILPDEVIEK